MRRSSLFAMLPLAAAFAAGGLPMTASLAADLNFDFKVNQGAVGTSFATLTVEELVPGTTTFTLNTALSGGQGNPGIVELFFGCNSCGTPIIIPGQGVSIQPGGTQAGYNFDYRAVFNPSAIDTNTPLTWTATTAPGTFLESTSGAGPDSFALIQLTGGMEVINGQNIESGFYVAAVPEPSTYALMLVGLGFAGSVVYRSRRKDHRVSM